MIDWAAICRCWAIESATSFSALILSSSVSRTVVVRDGMPSRGLVVKESSSVFKDMVARDEGRSGGRV